MVENFAENLNIITSTKKKQNHMKSIDWDPITNDQKSFAELGSNCIISLPTIHRHVTDAFNRFVLQHVVEKIQQKQQKPQTL